MLLALQSCRRRFLGRWFALAQVRDTSKQIFPVSEPFIPFTAFEPPTHEATRFTFTLDNSSGFVAYFFTLVRHLLKVAHTQVLSTWMRQRPLPSGTCVCVCVCVCLRLCFCDFVVCMYFKSSSLATHTHTNTHKHIHTGLQRD